MGDHIDGSIRIRRFLTETLDHGCTNGQRQAYIGHIIIWAMFLLSTLVPIITRKQCLTFVRYLSIVADQSAHHVNNVTGRLLYLPTRQWTMSYGFNRHGGVRQAFHEFQITYGPLNSPDVNPIEHLWLHLKISHCATLLPHRNVHRMLDQLMNVWYRMTQSIRTLSSRYPVGCWRFRSKNWSYVVLKTWS